jgi:hypothetical protein
MKGEAVTTASSAVNTFKAIVGRWTEREMDLTSLGICIVIGGALGLRFRVLILLSAIA